MKRFVPCVAVLSLLFGGAGQASADEFVFGESGEHPVKLTLTLDGRNDPVVLSTDPGGGNSNNFRQGWWSQVLSSVNENPNHVAGTIGDFVFRDFFTFNISRQAGELVTSATLSAVKNRVRSNSGRDFQTWALYDVSTDAATLNAKINNPNQAIFDDLGTGKSYGHFNIAVEDIDDNITVLDFAPNANALFDLNLALVRGDSDFSIGGSLETAAVVPEPGTLTLAGLGIAGFVGYVWRCRRAGAASA